MPSIRERQINRQGSTQTGHTVYPRAIDLATGKRIIYKLNKYGEPAFSRLEVAFNELTALFLDKNLTSAQRLVFNDEDAISGVASDHLYYSALRREGEDKGKNPVFYTIQKNGNDVTLEPKNPAIRPNDLPIHFFDQFESGLFPLLMEMYQEEKIRLDLDSLASIMTTAYTLEEDDLHKGNLAFYIVQDGDKPRVVFQTIDPDMKMADSIVSFMYPRFFNWRHGSDAFKITARDLRSFPVLQDSGLWFWLTKTRYLTKPSDSKTYNNQEVTAFSNLNQRPEFQNAKWFHFYKHILLTPDMLTMAIAESYDVDDPLERAQIAMITQATLERQARLRAVLLSMPEFRAFVRTMTPGDLKRMTEDIVSRVPESRQNQLRAQITGACEEYRQHCQHGGIAANDTPLHVAIRTGQFSPMAWKSFREFAEQGNGREGNPLDVAVAMLLRNPQWQEEKNIRANLGYTICYLLKKGVNETPTFRGLDNNTKTMLRNFSFKTEHMDNAQRAQNVDALIKVLQDVGEDIRFTLKMKKGLARHCVQHFIQTHPNLSQLQLRELQLAVNGDAQQPPRPELQYIRQLRSRLWLVRRIRGLLGGTATQVSINDSINQALAQRNTPSCFNALFSLFTPARPAQEPSVNPDGGSHVNAKPYR